MLEIKRLRVLPIPPNDKIRSHLVSNLTLCPELYLSIVLLYLRFIISTKVFQHKTSDEPVKRELCSPQEDNVRQSFDRVINVDEWKLIIGSFRRTKP